MTEIREGSGVKGWVVIKEINPKTGEVVSVEEGENIICVSGANALSTALQGNSAPGTFNYMVISTDVTAVARAHTAIAPQTVVSAVLTPTLNNTAPTSLVTWTNTFPASGGSSTVIAKFGMQSTSGGGNLWNEYLFTGTKDNVNNDLQVTYTASIAP